MCIQKPAMTTKNINYYVWLSKCEMWKNNKTKLTVINKDLSKSQHCIASSIYIFLC